MFIGFNLTFQPMMILGLLGMPRRIQSYPDGYGWDLLNVMATGGAFMIAASVLVFIYNVIISLRNGEPSGDDPWDARTLEWSIPSPPPPYNFAGGAARALAGRVLAQEDTLEDPHGIPIPVPAGAAEPAEGVGTATGTASICHRLRTCH